MSVKFFHLVLQNISLAHVKKLLVPSGYAATSTVKFQKGALWQGQEVASFTYRFRNGFKICRTDICTENKWFSHDGRINIYTGLTLPGRKVGAVRAHSGMMAFR